MMRHAVAWALFALLMMGCASPAAPKTLSRDQAIAIARAVDRKATWEARFEAIYTYEFNREKRQRPVWIAQALSPGPNTTVWIDAETGEVLTLRQSESAAPPPAPGN